MFLQLCSLLKSQLYSFMQTIVSQEWPMDKREDRDDVWERVDVMTFDCKVA